MTWKMRMGADEWDPVPEIKNRPAAARADGLAIRQGRLTGKGLKGK